MAGGEAVPTVESNLFEPERPSGRRLRLFGPGADPFGTTPTRVARGVQGLARTGSNDLVLRTPVGGHGVGCSDQPVRPPLRCAQLAVPIFDQGPLACNGPASPSREAREVGC